MAIWRKFNPSGAGEEGEKETRDQFAKEKDEKKKASEGEGSKKSSTIPDLNVAYDEEADDAAGILLPTKRSGCMMISDDKFTPAPATIDVPKYKTYVPSKLIVMGCSACYMYVMVPENDHVCPKCHKGTNLIDVCSNGVVHANKKRLI